MCSVLVCLQLANYIADSMQQVLQEAVGRKWKVNGFPQLQGCWPTHLGRLTLTQQAVALEVVAIQLELSLKFRKELNHNRTLRHRYQTVAQLNCTCCLFTRDFAHTRMRDTICTSDHMVVGWLMYWLVGYSVTRF